VCEQLVVNGCCLTRQSPARGECLIKLARGKQCHVDATELI